jgi:mannose-6-phosphate isomerase-like protein (cupin superfamily)
MQTTLRLADVNAERDAQGKRYLEFLRVPALSAGVYVLAAGAEDLQQPHAEDEIYYVLRGRARMRVGSGSGPAEDFDVAPGQLIFVPARAEHRFHSITEELELLVVFGPAESA